MFELPLKIESQQLLYKICTTEPNDLKTYLKELANYINLDVLEKIKEDDGIKE